MVFYFKSRIKFFCYAKLGFLLSLAITQGKETSNPSLTLGWKDNILSVYHPSIPGGKLDLAMQLILTPLIARLISLAKRS